MYTFCWHAIWATFNPRAFWFWTVIVGNIKFYLNSIFLMAILKTYCSWKVNKENRITDTMRTNKYLKADNIEYLHSLIKTAHIVQELISPYYCAGFTYSSLYDDFFYSKFKMYSNWTTMLVVIRLLLLLNYYKNGRHSTQYLLQVQYFYTVSNKNIR